MEGKFKITIPKPCHEDWNAMTPDQTGRFCGSCIKSVVDFTTMKTSEIQEYFTENSGKNVCGRFKNEQVNTFNMQIPQSVLQQKMPFRKAFLLTLFVVMGSTLFSCRNTNGSTLGEVAVVNDTIAQDSIQPDDMLVGEISIDQRDSLHLPRPLLPKPKIDEVKFIKKPSTKTENK
ncbi:hypothetical protein [Flavobacterium humi]|uniref:Uncharacterized protein n=1 Tax=Flavobacterium humi TaxID=2562683 RepID=A0A4Z0L936_9FLAO|nr:hypothetical protein [Flavobacterium humi]TGD57685.1 hypothetical protein E4635_10900 [Flavobacterium humi]